VRIDRSDHAVGPGNVDMARRARSTADGPDTAGKNKGIEVGDGPDLAPGRPDSTLQAERTMAYRAVVDAAFRQHAFNRSDTRAKTNEDETVSPAVRVTNAATRNEAAGAFEHRPATASADEGSIGEGGGAQPPTVDNPPGPEGDDDPEGLNGGLGELVSVNAKDRAADLLADRIGGKASVRFANGPSNEFDAVSHDYVAQAKPANFTLNQAFRDQAKVTFEVAVQSDRTPYFQFDGAPGPGVLRALSRYAERYGIEPVIDLTSLGESNA
jgi:Restriction endonuclease fold toxin 3